MYRMFYIVSTLTNSFAPCAAAPQRRQMLGMAATLALSSLMPTTAGAVPAGDGTALTICRDHAPPHKSGAHAVPKPTLASPYRCPAGAAGRHRGQEGRRRGHRGAQEAGGAEPHALTRQVPHDLRQVEAAVGLVQRGGTPPDAPFRWNDPHPLKSMLCPSSCTA